jgi:hypothetical protein
MTTEANKQLCRDYFTAFLKEEKADNDQIMTCCSRAKSARLVLDI